MLLVVGRIGRAHGVRGDVFVEPFTDEPEIRFAQGSNLTTSNKRTLTVASTKWHSGKFVVHFVGIDDRTMADEIKSLELSIDVDPLQLPTDPDEFYDHQLIGLTAKLVDGSTVGKVSEVVHLPAQDLLAIVAEPGNEVLVPFVKQIVPEIDILAGIVTLNPPPGLLDDSEAEVVRGEADAD
ncbi:MAG: ribosome maturation factor RimM [Actinobacteria bacterium]|nr:ribosome maturation factor RimM [Actinomycetota bacterium]NBY14812.1 ribosome maturation factor RimM [Actinomycetota bacterium]